MSDTNPNTPIYYLTAADLLLKQCLHDITVARKAGTTPDHRKCPKDYFLKNYSLSGTSLFANFNLQDTEEIYPNIMTNIIQFHLLLTPYGPRWWH
jgi:hypothetical protein